MNPRASIGLLLPAIAFVGASLLPASVHGQTARSGPAKNWMPSRTPDGQPDMQGSYSHVGLGTGKEDKPANLCPEGGCYETNWFTEPSKGKLKLTLPMNVVEPADGRLPLQPWAAAWKKEYQELQSDPQKLEQP